MGLTNIKVHDMLMAHKKLVHLVSGHDSLNRLATKWKRIEIRRKRPKQTIWIPRPACMIEYPDFFFEMEVEVLSAPS